MRDDVKSPLKAAPLRVAGQSLSEQLIDNAYDHIVGPYLLAAFFVALAVMEWVRYYFNAAPSPWLYTSLATIGVGWSVIKIRRGIVKAKSIRQGRDGERAVAQYLEKFRAQGFQIFHDVLSGDANIDHVLIGPRGVYTVETKTISKPQRGACTITVSDGVVKANGRTIERDPLVQAKAQARWLHNFLAESELKAFVQPVVVFPGWYVERFDMKAAGVWVLEPKALGAFLEQQQETLSADQARAMASALASYVRTKNAS